MMSWNWPPARRSCAGFARQNCLGPFAPGTERHTPAQDKDGLVVFHLPADSPKVTTDDVRRIETEGA
jgi:hypothetical protein